MNLLVLISCLLIVELLISFTPLWRFRRPAVLVMAPLFTIVTVYLALFFPSFGTYLLVAVNCYRIVNFGRILQGRLHDSYLLNSVRRTSLWLGFSSLAATALSLASWPLNAVVAVVGVVVGLVGFSSVLRQTRRSMPIASNVPAGNLPTVTVAIPARNETTDLEECLQSVLASNYPKLEILVLDDNSRGKAAEIIRDFAHDGVRFIPGDKPRPNWLAKNQAYQRLAHEANGQVILFCGVDIRFQPDSIRNMVGELQHDNLQMLCVVPDNHHDARQTSVPLIQPWRYVWEFALPRQLFRRPAVLSSCWLIRKTALKHSGGFAAVTRMIVPESYFAREFVKVRSYRLVRSAGILGVASRKSVAEQQATAIRTRYPQLHKRPEQVMLTSLVQLVGLVAPFILFVVCLVQGRQLYAISLAVAVTLLLAAYYQVVRLGNYRRPLSAVAALPIVVLTDVYLLNLSMWRYEFGEIYWKGRPVTDPVMHATPHLPKV